ncbi:MAG: hypothetical protein M3O41_20415 [Pseudomonadota bacterium]|nr:hypothetical protein [Pseudomonadota bacterium]
MMFAPHFAQGVTERAQKIIVGGQDRAVETEFDHCLRLVDSGDLTAHIIHRASVADALATGPERYEFADKVHFQGFLSKIDDTPTRVGPNFIFFKKRPSCVAPLASPYRHFGPPSTMALVRTPLPG